MMIPTIMTDNFIKLGVVDDYISFIWTSRYYNVGDFELVIPMTSRALDYIKKDYYIQRDDDSENLGIIEEIKVQSNADGKEQMIISGRFLASILGRRIIASQSQFNNQNVCSIIYALIDENVINPEIEARKITMGTSSVQHIQTAITMQVTGKNLLDTIQGLCETYHMGFKVIYGSNYSFHFRLYVGKDRTYDQSANPYAVFSDKYDNLLTAEYIESYENLVTDVLVAGEGEGTDRKTAWASKDNPTGLARYELFKDARNMSTDEGEISDEEYTASLISEGMESITGITQAFSGKVDFENVKFKTDINLGDICVIENSRWGLHINSRLVEVIESVNENGVYTITPSFGI